MSTNLTLSFAGNDIQYITIQKSTTRSVCSATVSVKCECSEEQQKQERAEASADAEEFSLGRSDTYVVGRQLNKYHQPLPLPSVEVTTKVCRVCRVCGEHSNRLQHITNAIPTQKALANNNAYCPHVGYGSGVRCLLHRQVNCA